MLLQNFGNFLFTFAIRYFKNLLLFPMHLMYNIKQKTKKKWENEINEVEMRRWKNNNNNNAKKSKALKEEWRKKKYNKTNE